MIDFRSLSSSLTSLCSPRVGLLGWENYCTLVTEPPGQRGLTPVTRARRTEMVAASGADRLPGFAILLVSSNPWIRGEGAEAETQCATWDGTNPRLRALINLWRLSIFLTPRMGAEKYEDVSLFLGDGPEAIATCLHNYAIL